MNETGRAQAASLRDRLAVGPRVSRIWASDLERARQTAEIAAGAFGGMPIDLDEGLREVDVGAWTGRSYAEIEQEFPEEWAAWSRGLDVRRGGGETYAELAERLHAAMLRIAEAQASSEEHVLVVSHGAAIKSFAAKVLGLGDVGRVALGPVGNTSVTVLKRRGSSFEIVLWNDTAHLGDPLQRL